MRKTYWFLILLIAFVVFTCVVYYNVLNVGLILRQHNEYIEYVFYVLCIILYIALVIDPLISIFFAPLYSVSKIASGDEADYNMCRKLYKNLLKNGNLKQDDKDDLKAVSQLKMSERPERLNKKLYLVYNNAVKKNIDEYILDTAKNTFYFTAISQNGFVDMLVVLVNNFKMVKALVKMCGFRPSFIRIIKLYLNIFFSSLVADGAQNLNLTNILGASLGSGLKLVTNSVTNGIINAFFMLRTGYLTKEYLFTEDAKFKKTELRKTAMMEAASLLPAIITSVITDPLKSLSKLLFKGNTEVNKEDEEDVIIDLNQKWHKKK